MANEKRLIDANALKNFVCELCNAVNSDEPCEPSDCRCMCVIDEMPTVDAVEVVRCKDCKHWNCWRNSGEGSGDCLLDEGYATLATQHYDFCSYGERREGK